MKKALQRLPRILLRIAGAALVLILLAFAGAALILAQPQEERETPVSQPLLTASPAVIVQEESRLREIMASAPLPVMSFMSGSGMIFVSAASADATVEEGFGRVVTLHWQTPEGDPVTLQSIYPATAYSLMEGGYHFSRIAGPALFGAASIRMEKDGAIRLHTATDDGLYTITVPENLRADLSALCRSLQLFTA